MTLPCIICERPLESAIPAPSTSQEKKISENQPYAGTAFTTRGHYGSTVFDMEPGFLEINICDPCLLSKHELILHGEHHQPPVQTEYRPWDISYLKKNSIPPGRTERVVKG